MPQDNQINYNVKVRLDPNTQGADSSVIYDFSEKKFALGTGTGITITNPINNNILTANDSQNNIIGESFFRWVDGGTGGTSEGKAQIGLSATDYATPNQLLDVGIKLSELDATKVPQAIFHAQTTDDNFPFLRIGLDGNATNKGAAVIGLGNKFTSDYNFLQLGIYGGPSGGSFLPKFSMNLAGRIAIGEDTTPNPITNANSLVEMSGAFTSPENEDTSILELTNTSTSATQFNKGLIIRLNVQQGGNGGSLSNPQFIQFKKRGYANGVFFTAGAIVLDPSGQADLIGTSDLRLKTDIKPLPVGLKELLKIKPREYLWKDNLMPSRGFIAQELYEVYPEAANKPQIEDDPINNPWTVSQIKLIPLLVKSIQDQQKIIDKLEEEINKLKIKNK